MPYAPAIPQYTPMAPFKPTPFTPAESSDQFLASTTAAMQPALSAQQGTFQQALALQQQELALAKKAQADALSNYYYSTPPWGARAAQSPPSTAAPVQPQAPPTTAPPPAQATPQGISSITPNSSGKPLSPAQITELLRKLGFSMNPQGRYATPQLAY